MLFHTSRVLASIALCTATIALAQSPAPKPAEASKATAPAKTSNGNAGKVWGNLDSKIYHCEGDHYWGNTKNGDYMTLADAKAKGMTAAKTSKNCKKE